MKKHKFLKLLVVCIILVAICLIVCFAVCTMKYSTKKMTVYLKDGNSYASNWTYDMSVEGVLAECNHQVLYAYAGDYQYWEFEAVGVGVEVPLQEGQHSAQNAAEQLADHAQAIALVAAHQLAGAAQRQNAAAGFGDNVLQHPGGIGAMMAVTNHRRGIAP